MTREIKFRAWDKKENKFFDGYSNILYLLSQCIRDPNYDFQQFTGLRDRNGKEIYEGDIVKKKNTILTILWSDGGGYWRAQPTGDSIRLGNINSDCEVIGNIYENEVGKETK